MVEYLRLIDITGVNWIADRPQTELYRLAKSCCVELLLKFFAYIYEQRSENVKLTYKATLFLKD